MSRLALFTFHAQTSDTKVLTQEMVSLLQPQLQKLKQYIIVREKRDTPQEHLHFLFFREYPRYETEKIKQFIENTGIQKFKKNRLPETNTIYNEHSFNYLKIANSTEDHMYYVGYVCKEPNCLPEIKGFTQEYILKCVNYYYAKERSKASKIDNTWKHLKPNEIHCYMEHYSQKLNIPLDDPRLMLEMKANKISFNQLTSRNINISKQELIIAHKHDVSEFSYKVSEADVLKSIHEDDWTYWKALAVQRENRIEELNDEVKYLENEIKKLKKGGI